MPILKMRDVKTKDYEDIFDSAKIDKFVKKYLDSSGNFLWYGNGPSSSKYSIYVKDYYVIEYNRVS